MKVTRGLSVDSIPIIRLESSSLQVDVAPEVGGRVVSLVEKSTGHEFLWRNAGLKLERMAPHSAYDPNFYGGIDELIPNDMPEHLNGVDSPDHGELWTTALSYASSEDELTLKGTLPLCGLAYERRLSLREGSPHIDIAYRIHNPTAQRRKFLWKLHAALAIAPGDRVLCPAGTARVVDLEWSRWHTLEAFGWPVVEGQRADLIPVKDGTVDFLFLYDLAEGSMAWQSAAGDLTFAYTFDSAIFPYAWYFASYGGFDDHYTAILEPCTAMPLSVVEAAQLGQCSVLEAGQTLETQVTVYAGPTPDKRRS